MDLLKNICLIFSFLINPMTNMEFKALLRPVQDSADEVIFQGEKYFDESGQYQGPRNHLLLLLEIIESPPQGQNRRACLWIDFHSKTNNSRIIFERLKNIDQCSNVWPSWQALEIQNIEIKKVLKVSPSDFEIHFQNFDFTIYPLTLQFAKIPSDNPKPKRFSSYHLRRPHLKNFPLMWFNIGKGKNYSFPSTQTDSPRPWICKEYNLEKHLIRDDCISCPWSPLPVFNAKTPNQLSYWCNPQNCGERNLPPCLLGVAHLLKWQESDYCANGKEIGTCLDGATPTCQKNGDLLCP